MEDKDQELPPDAAGPADADDEAAAGPGSSEPEFLTPGDAASFAAGLLDSFEPGRGEPDVDLEDADDELIEVNETSVTVEPAQPHGDDAAAARSEQARPETRAWQAPRSVGAGRRHDEPIEPIVPLDPPARPGRPIPAGAAPGFRADPGFAIGFDDELREAGIDTRARETFDEEAGDSAASARGESAVEAGTDESALASTVDERAAAGEATDVDAAQAEREGEDRPSREDERRGRRRRGGRGRGRGRKSDRDEAAEGEAADGESKRAAAPVKDQAAVPAESPEPEVADEDDMRASAGPVALPGLSREVDIDEEQPRRRRGRGRVPRRPVPDDEVETPSADPDEPPASREMLINVADSDECRIAILRDGRLDELYMERAASVSNVMNIYKGRVTNVEPSIQAAFVDFGLPAHGFLHISDLHPRYFPESKGEPELVGRKTPRRARPPIQSCLRRGQEVIVQVIKEGIGTKGPTLSTYISVPGRFLVMMPGMDQHGVSRKVEDPEVRRKMREILGALELPKDMGFIVRTAGVGRTQRDLQRDLNYLVRLWNQVVKRMREEPAPAELYKESDLVIRTIRDVYDASLKRIYVDSAAVADRVREFLSIASPNAEDVVAVSDDAEPLFHRYGIEAEIDKLHSRSVPLACGGSLVIEPTEALVAIDVNSGRFRVPESAEETAYRVNLEAADEIARQLRLRDLGGLIICDFIDMLQDKHRRTVERRLAQALRDHKERAKLLRISKFGILEMTRQRQRPSFAKNMFAECPRCHGSGRVKSIESVCLDVMRQIRLASHRDGVASIDVRVHAGVATELLNRKRHTLTDIERNTGQSIRIHAEPAYGIDEIRLSCIDRRGREVIGAAPAAPPIGRRAPQPAKAASSRGAAQPPSERATRDGESGQGRRRGRRGSRGGRGRGGRGRRRNDESAGEGSDPSAVSASDATDASDAPGASDVGDSAGPANAGQDAIDRSIGFAEQLEDDRKGNGSGRR